MLNSIYRKGSLLLVGLFLFMAASAQPEKIDSSTVKIISFEVDYVPASKSVIIHWVTQDERTGVKYIIERSLDSNTYRMIGFAKSSNNDKKKKDYYSYDSNPIGGQVYYRIREVLDTGMQYVTHPQIVLTPIPKMELAQLVLSGDNNEINFAIISPDDSKAGVLISDLQGNIKSSYALELERGANVRSIYTGNLSPGVYFLQVNDLDNGSSVMKKFIIENPDAEH